MIYELSNELEKVEMKPTLDGTDWKELGNQSLIRIETERAANKRFYDELKNELGEIKSKLGAIRESDQNMLATMGKTTTQNLTNSEND